MKNYFNQHANLSNRGAMEARYHTKNGASPKSHTSRIKKISIQTIIGVLLILSIFTGCNSGTSKKDVKLTKVRVAQFGEVFIYMPLYLANAKGFFRDEGLQVEIINTGGDDKTFAAVIGGSAAFGIADPTFVAIAKEQGLGGKVIASIVNGVPFWGITKNGNIPGITDAAQLKGYSVATFASPSTAYTLQYEMFEKAGLKPNIRQGALGSLWAMLEAGQADIALELEPNVSNAVKQGAKVLYSLAEVYGDFAMTGVTVSDETASSKPELVQRFVNALQKAETFAHAFPDSVAFFAGKIFPDIDKTVSANAVNRIISTGTFPKNVIISNKAWENAIRLRQKAGDIKSVETALSVLDMSFARKAIENNKITDSK
jgi:NitT/TauT family transport system substrate-binding protein